jgi:predicted membrane protein
MAIIYYFVFAMFLIYAVYFLYKNEKDREMQLHLHLLQAKKILNSADLKDKRKWFIGKFDEAENHLISAQASCAKEFELDSIIDIRNKLQEIKNNYNN